MAEKKRWEWMTGKWESEPVGWGGGGCEPRQVMCNT